MDCTEKAKKAFAKLGDIKSQSAKLWEGPFELPNALAEFYLNIGPSSILVPGIGNDYFFPDLAGLWKYQEGYRYHSDTGILCPEWNDDWIVIADEGGDPFIISREKGCILHDLHGQGAWDPNEFVSDILTFAGSIASLGVIVAETKLMLTDADFHIKKEYMQRARRDLELFLESPEDIEAFLFMVGWVQE
jgi:hypothetical protein